jgi:hypothetical protein
MKFESSRTPSALRARESSDQQHFPRCEQCNGLLTSPEWSEQVNGRCVRHLWSCKACGYRFESWVYARRTDRAA